MYNAQNVADKIKKMLFERNITVKKMCQGCKLGVNGLSNIRKGDIKNIETFQTIAQYFNVSVDYLLGRVDHNVVPVALEKDTVKIPVLGRIAAGVPIDAVEEILEYIEIPASLLAGGKTFFALKLKGDSMSPEYLSGDVVIFEQCDTCDTGDDCAVMINGNDATFKRIERKENGIMVKPLNPQYETMFFTNKEVVETPVRILGIARELRRRK